MSMKHGAFVPGALAVLGIALGVALVTPAAYAGQKAVTIKPVEDLDVPEGSQIPARRIEETETKVQELKTQLRATAPAKQQESQPQETLPESEGEQQ